MPAKRTRKAAAPVADQYEGLRAARDAETKRADDAEAATAELRTALDERIKQIAALKAELSAAVTELRATT